MRARDVRTGRALLAWIGLGLMAASFVCLQLLSPGSRPRVELPLNKAEGPFALVVLDPGHGGRDSGTIKGGILEKDLALDVANRAERLFQQKGFATLVTRSDDTYVSLADRAALANAQRECIFVSIHFDDATRAAATGVETYYAAHQVSDPSRMVSWLPFLQPAAMESGTGQSESLAAFIQEALVARTQAVNRGTAAQQFYVISHVRHPAVLIEGGFLTNVEDMNKLANSDYREQIAAAICDGVVRYRAVQAAPREPRSGDAPSVE